MEQFPISKDDRGFVIEGISDAVKVVRIGGPKAKRLADLALHRADLDFAAACLANINRVPEEPLVLRQSLWRSAIVHYAKCFGTSASRFQLDAAAIYKANPLAVENFDYFWDLRNKNIVHDENSYHQSIPGAALNDGSKAFKVEKIICFNAVAETLGQDNYNNLHLLISTALAWVTAQFDELCSLVTKELEAQPYETLFAREGIEYRTPHVQDVGRKRDTP